MIHDDSDEIEKILDPIPASSRNLLWISSWLMANCIEIQGTPTEAYKDNTSTALYFLKKYPQLFPQVSAKFKNSIVHKKHLSWISEGRRLEKWINNQVGPLSQIHLVQSQCSDLDFIILKIDLWEAPAPGKVKFLEDLELKWKSHKSNDRIYTWFDTKEKISLASDWLNNNKEYGEPTPIVHDKEDLMSYFENKHQDKEYIAFQISKIKARWHQNKYRKSNKSKSQKNLLLSDRSIKNLQELSSKHNITQSKAIEILIEMENTHQLYIPETTDKANRPMPKYSPSENKNEKINSDTTTQGYALNFDLDGQ
ncbi:hypothetical protein SAMN05216198_3874 [Halopseudomonas litoralis]|uniref:Uncharacterized protein n=1 Tax=Halopseudomonas litoralis TaxID=797277 RepID=A0A1H1Y6I2_9GAMM|nr:hypothetical protein [Halopseudomonas litoralis]SDT17128.1 hypothetical protein SAMN05216198_3874 [Halopseudomonas litoralis]